jgi:hypothetical protein
MDTNFKDDIDMLRAYYKTDSAAKTVLDHFAARQRNANVTKVESLASALDRKGADLGYYEIVKVLKALCEMNFGTYTTGRRGHKSRVNWRVSTTTLGQAAAGARSDIEGLRMEDASAVEGDDDDDNDLIVNTAEPESRHGTGLKRVVYPLRRDVDVELMIPKDFTKRDAQRLAEFIKALPFDDSEPEA